MIGFQYGGKKAGQTGREAAGYSREGADAPIGACNVALQTADDAGDDAGYGVKKQARRKGPDVPDIQNHALIVDAQMR